MLRQLTAQNLKLNDHQRRAKTPAKLTQSKTGQWRSHTHSDAASPGPCSVLAAAVACLAQPFNYT